MKRINKIALVIPYFGSWPEWIDLYMLTIEKNENIDVHFITNCDQNVTRSPNIFFHVMTFDDYVRLAKNKIGVSMNIPNAYKICDLRPFLGIMHFDIIKNYDFYGWADVDLLFGNISDFYTSNLLSRYDVFSTHKHRLSGHFSLFRNTFKNRTIYKKIYHWKEALINPEFVGIDEHGLTNAYTMTIFDKINEKFNWKIENFFTRFFSKKRKEKLYMKEQYTTPFTNIPWIDGSINSFQPATWLYKDGVITNNRDKEKNFIYLHFMNFKSSLWRHDKTEAPWEGKGKICMANANDMKTGIAIDSEGIHKI